MNTRAIQDARPGWRERFNAMVETCAETARAERNRMACAGLNPPMALTYRPSEPGRDGELAMRALADDGAVKLPEGWRLYQGAAMPASLASSRVFTWIYDRATGLPVLRPS